MFSCSINDNNLYCLLRDCSLTFFVLPVLPYTCCKLSHAFFEVAAYEIFWNTFVETHWCKRTRALQSSCLFSRCVSFCSAEAFLESKNNIHLHAPILITFPIKHRKISRYGIHSSHNSTPIAMPSTTTTMLLPFHGPLSMHKLWYQSVRAS